MENSLNLKVALCGMGDRLTYVTKTFQQVIDGFNVVGFADPSVDRQSAASQDESFGQAYEDLSTLIAEQGPDLVMIGSPNALHLSHIRTALEAGVTVWTEKPVVTTKEQTFELLQLIRQYGEDRILVGLVLRYSPLYKALIATKESGQLGNVVSIEASEHIEPAHGAFFMRDWRRDSKLSGGFMLEKCCHDLDLYQGVAGARAMRVASFGGRRSFVAENSDLEALPIYHKRKTRWGGTDKVFAEDGDIIDHQTALIEYANGVNMCFHTNLNVPDEFRRFCVIGSRGMAEGDFVRNFFTVHDAATYEKIADESFHYDDGISVHYGAEVTMAEEIKNYFLHATALPVSVIDALEAGLTAIAIDEARISGTVIDLTETWEKFDAALGKAAKAADLVA